MRHEKHKNYFEILSIAPDSSLQEIEQAISNYEIGQTQRLAFPHLMNAARAALDEIPEMRRCLLSDAATRAAYQQQLAQQEAEAARRAAGNIDLADDEGLDDEIEHAFFFNPDNYDTEMPAYTLREIAEKIDSNWQTAYQWMRHTANDVHPVVAYLEFAAGRKQLAERIEQCITTIPTYETGKEPSIKRNEVLEQCIAIFDPERESPTVEIGNTHFDGEVLDIGAFIPDLPIKTELLLRHDGDRGCAFGTVESRTPWLTFDGGAATAHFSLMPKGTPPVIGISEVVLPLVVNGSTLRRDADYWAELIVHIESRQHVQEIYIRVLMHLLPLPPRVTFTPVATQENPLLLPKVLRGKSVVVSLVPCNQGDEQKVPLQARIVSREIDNASIQPQFFGDGMPLTITIDTSNRPFGTTYTISLRVDYITANTLGPQGLYLQGEILPTFWQSLQRTRAFSNRIGIAITVGLICLFLTGLLGLWMQSHSFYWWILIPLIPLICFVAMSSYLKNFVEHMHHAGDVTISIEKIAIWLRWWLPIGFGLLLVLICALLPNALSAFWVSGIAGMCIGGFLGFFSDAFLSS